ncbi:sugar phosphate isomerase/epimerase family protein [Pseudoramibacter sp.]|jgi:sugar phosphate isomerase/epimerase|uniref:sugar phosphate isomerase/epimerase family protein n=1 Tax=Pseudoramibacter sp. TaxID=2034862 RepID=UPI0025DD601F|nr:sugar phosphate isomerase/epimerase family protein [Pseudoramibacter sp.]MCH4071506.1 sugar phosphate isomerase/epimerase [Pseudoramibacter sp.]MCH4105274.1 sugar phosphate isomerase/epimerase [Pseudoramibacter sp.]
MITDQNQTHWTASMFSWFGYFMPFDDRIAAIADAGFDEVMLSWEDEEGPAFISRYDFPDKVNKAGLGITNFHAPFIGYSTIWEKPFEENRGLFEQLAGIVKDAASFDVPAVVVHTVDMELGDHCFENGYRFFSKLAEVGEQYGVDIAVENVTRQFLLYQLLDQIQSGHFGYCYDTSHDYMLGCGRGRLLRQYPGRMKALHFSDNDLTRDRHWIPGDGFLPLKDIVNTLDQMHWHILSCEVMAPFWWQDKVPKAFCQTVDQRLNYLLRNKI